MSYDAYNSLNTNTVKAYECPEPPSESISCVEWAPIVNKNLLAVGSWDKTVRIYDVQHVRTQIQATRICLYNNNLPVLDNCISSEGVLFFSGCCQTAKMVHLGQEGATPQVVAQHDLPVNCVRWAPQAVQPVLLTGGWDGKVKVWDCKQPNAIHQIDLGGPAVDMDVTEDMATIATANDVTVVNLRTMSERRYTVLNPTTKKPLLVEQIRCVGNFTDKSGFAIGSIEGRIGVCWLEALERGTLQDNSKNVYSFKCHRVDNDVFSLNSVSFHPKFGTFATCGSNGEIVIWCKDNKSRLKHFNNIGNSIPCGSFSPTGELYAYAVSYDWSKGPTHYNPTSGHKIRIKHITDDMAKYKPKPKPANRNYTASSRGFTASGLYR